MMITAHKDLSKKIAHAGDNRLWQARFAVADYGILPAVHLLTELGGRNARQIKDFNPNHKILAWITTGAANPNNNADGYEMDRRLTLLAEPTWDPKGMPDADPSIWFNHALTSDGKPAASWWGPDGRVGTADDAWVVDPHNTDRTRSHAGLIAYYVMRYNVPVDGVIIDYIANPNYGHFAYGGHGVDLDEDGIPTERDADWQAEKVVWHAWYMQTIYGMKGSLPGLQVWSNGHFWDTDPQMDVYSNDLTGVYFERVGMFGWQRPRTYLGLKEAVQFQPGVILDSTLSSYWVEELKEIARDTGAIYQYPAGELMDA